jgi:predicted acylesterase/phospholipase RssA
VEIAAQLRERDLEVTLIEARDLLYKLHAPDISAFFLALLQGHGVRCLCHETPKEIIGRTRVEGILTAHHGTIACDLVIIGAGVTPRIEFLKDSGIACDDGVLVDEYLQTNQRDVFAAGDVACVLHPLFKQRERIEHWDNAIKQARTAARNMLGLHQPYTDISYFYSHVFEQSFNVLGSPLPGDTRINRGSLESGLFETLYLRDDVLRALFTLGGSKDNTRAAEALIRNHTNLIRCKAKLKDPAFALAHVPGQKLFVLQGGGAFGAFECGAVCALEQRGIYPDIVAGVSIGAFNAAIVAGNPQRPAQALQAFWHEISVASPPAANEQQRRELAAQQVAMWGVPGFFKPKWFNPWQFPRSGLKPWTSLYDFGPARDLLKKYVDFDGLKSSPIRLIVTALDVRTSEIVMFDSYLDRLTPDHIIASGSLPPAFDSTHIDGRDYWDAGIVSNSPLEAVLDRTGRHGKQIYLIDLFTGQRDELPSNLTEVYARREEIIFSDRIKSDDAQQDLNQSFQTLIKQMVTHLPQTARMQIERQPLYIQLMGRTADTRTIRIVRQPRAGQPISKAYDFSVPTISQLIADGRETALQIIKQHSNAE